MSSQSYTVENDGKVMQGHKPSVTRSFVYMTRERFYGDSDPVETQEWLDALASVLENEGPERAKYLLDKMGEKARQSGLQVNDLTTPYINTI
ncbi:MAG TPA: hypothetical protein DD667_11775, partial [Gammaproteobacteria bacterium]|nr:hypothetical protein [Gammaproteobacteria bacterium]